MIVGDPLTFDLRDQKAFGEDSIVFKIVGQSGNALHARWQSDANRFQVAAALERLATALRRTEI